MSPLNVDPRFIEIEAVEWCALCRTGEAAFEFTETGARYCEPCTDRVKESVRLRAPEAEADDSPARRSA